MTPKLPPSVIFQAIYTPVKQPAPRDAVEKVLTSLAKPVKAPVQKGPVQ